MNDRHGELLRRAAELKAESALKTPATADADHT